MKPFGFLTACLVSATFAGTAVADGTLTYTLDLSNPGTFSLFASASSGDNLGIASYQVTLEGNILTQDHLSPNGNVFDVPAFEARGPIGFTLLRSGDGVLGSFTASQDTVTPTEHIVFGLGQEIGNLATSVQSDGDSDTESILGGEQVDYTELLLIATGTYTGELTFGSPLGGNLFTNGSVVEDATATAPDQINTVIIPVPEPGSMALLGLGGLALLRRRR